MLCRIPKQLLIRPLSIRNVGIRTFGRTEHTATSLKQTQTNDILRETSLSHPDPASDSPSAALVNSHAPYLLTTYARPPLVFVRGQGSYLWDLENRKYIDFTAGIAVVALGHSDPTLAQLMYDQALQLTHCSNLYHSPWAGELAKLMIETTKSHSPQTPFQKVFFSNSGTESNEAALKFVRKVGKQRGGNTKTDIVAFERAFHGRTFGALSVTPQPKYQKPFAPMVPGVKIGKLNDIPALEELVDEKTCGVIVEPIQGEGGVYEASEEFLTALRERCNKVGAVLIYDEIQCGLSRTGKLWAHHHFSPSVAPDILTMAKPLANGFPIGAVLVSSAIADEIKVGDHGTTFGGNPLATRLAHHAFQRLSSPEMLSQIASTSAIFKSHLQKFQDSFPELVDSIRGKGLILGIQLKSIGGKSSSDIAGMVVTKAREKGLLIITAGEGTLRLVPPLNISEEAALEGLKVLEEAMKDVVRDI